MAVMDLVTGGGTRSLPQPKKPDGYTEELFQRGTVRRMASGVLVREATSTTVFRRFTIEWVYLNPTQLGIVNNAVADMDDGSTASFTNPQGTTYTVVLAEDSFPTWKITTDGAGTFRYSGRLILEQNS
jgi:hypothetical protein